MARFLWIPWNVEHITGHGVTREEAEWVLAHPAPGYPRKHRGGYVVWGQTRSGRWLQVAFARERVGGEARVFVFHARPLTPNEKRRLP
jgi:hypothetical protein